MQFPFSVRGLDAYCMGITLCPQQTRSTVGLSKENPEEVERVVNLAQYLACGSGRNTFHVLLFVCSK